MTTARIGGVVLLCGLAFWLGRATGDGGLERLESGLAALDQRLDAQARARGTECVGAFAALANHPGVSPQQIEDAVAKAFASERPAGAAAARPTEDPQPDAPPPSAQAQAALERGRQVLASAASQRRWTPTEAEAFRGALPDLDPAARRALMSEFSRAVNNDAFKLEIVGPPF